MRPDGVDDPVALWTSSAFVEAARTWVAAQLAPIGIGLTGEWEQPHARVWSSTIRFDTTDGRVWFKVNGIGTAYEAKLVALLDELRPGLAPAVLAYDHALAWSITQDAGPVLRSRAEPEALLQLVRRTGVQHNCPWSFADCSASSPVNLPRWAG